MYRRMRIDPPVSLALSQTARTWSWYSRASRLSSNKLSASTRPLTRCHFNENHIDWLWIKQKIVANVKDCPWLIWGHIYLRCLEFYCTPISPVPNFLNGIWHLRLDITIKGTLLSGHSFTVKSLGWWVVGGPRIILSSPGTGGTL